MLLSLALFLLLFIGGLIGTSGNLLAAGGGATVFGLLPFLIFFGGLFYLKRKNSRYFYHSALVFWLCLAVSLGLFFAFVRGMDHWPFGLAFLFILFGLFSLLQAGTFLVLNRLRERGPSF
jgi:hypothetical protein